MGIRLVIDGNSVYEIDEECRGESQDKAAGRKRRENGNGREERRVRTAGET